MLHEHVESAGTNIPFQGAMTHAAPTEYHFQQEYRIALEVVSQLLRYPDAALHSTLLRLCCTAQRDTPKKYLFDYAGPSKQMEQAGQGGQEYQWVQDEAARILGAGLPSAERHMGRPVAEAYPQLAALTSAFARSVAHMGLTELQAAYVQAFDLEPSSSLHLSWHVYGDSPRQGRALAAFNEIYHDAGFEPLPGELPDYLPLVLEFMAIGPQWAAQCLCQHFGFTLRKLAGQLTAAQSPYAVLLHHVVEVLHIPSQAADNAAKDDHEVKV